MIAPRVSDAIERIQTEQKQVTAERTAFERFIKRVAALDSSKRLSGTDVRSLSSHQNQKGISVVNQPIQEISPQNADSGSKSIESVWTAYEETVMSVSHHQDVYGESLVEDFTAELGQNLVCMLTENDVLTPQLQTAILNQGQQARKRRTDLLNQVEAEHKTLVNVRRQLRELSETTTAIEKNLSSRPFQELVQSWERLEMMTVECETLLRERQANIQTGKKLVSMESVQQYLYQPFQWRYPVLNDGLEVVTCIQEAKQETANAIYDW